MNMPKTNTEKLKAKVKDGSHTLKEPIPVIVNLDNGETYKGSAFEVRPDGLIMVQTGNCDLGVQISCISEA
jgi:hypothetical protein